MRVFDIETDGLLDTVTKVHCINVIDRSLGTEYRFTDHAFYQDLDGSYTDVPTPRAGTIADGIAFLLEADAIGGQNIIGYDNVVLEMLYGFTPTCKVRDTKVMSEVMYHDLRDKDFAAYRKGRLGEEFFKRGLAGAHKLEAWGLRIGKELKDDFDPKNYIDPRTGEPHTWKTMPFTQDMDDYCMQDVRTAVSVFEHFESKGWSEECMELEHQVKRIIVRQERRGFAFDEEKARKLYAELVGRKLDLEAALKKTFKPWYAPDVKAGTALVTSKSSRKVWVKHEEGGRVRHFKERRAVLEDGSKAVIPARDERGFYEEYTAGVEHSRIKLVEFNPGSRAHIADRMSKLYGWVPSEFTPDGRPKVDETILGSLPYPEAKLCADYLLIEKRLGFLGDGQNALIKMVRNGRIHGRVGTCDAVTGRMAHKEPNIAQTPRVGSPYGAEFRELFTAGEGYVLVGCDAEGLELRIMAHYMAKYDGGEYAAAVVNGKKEEGTDVHTRNQKGAGLNTRDAAKTFIYALIYGAGDFKLGSIVYDDFTDEQKTRFNAKYATPRSRAAGLKALGTKRRARLMNSLPALKMLTDAVKAAAKRRGYLTGLDGRRLMIRKEHAALNTLFQSGGAVVMKKALVILDDRLTRELSFRPGNDYEFVANVHDEFQVEAKEEISETVGREAAEAITAAGVHFNLRCPLAGSFSIGANWRETH